MADFTRRAVALATLVAAMTTDSEALGGYESDNVVHNGVTHRYHPWNNVNLSKAERIGKTPEELQAMRKQRWEEAQKAIQSEKVDTSVTSG